MRLSATRLPYDLFPADEERESQVLPGRPEGLGLPRRFEEFELRAAIMHARFLASSLGRTPLLDLSFILPFVVCVSIWPMGTERGEERGEAAICVEKKKCEIILID